MSSDEVAMDMRMGNESQKKSRDGDSERTRYEVGKGLRCLIGEMRA